MTRPRSCNWAFLLAITLGVVSAAAAEPATWATPDGRYIAAFPTAPKETRLDVQGGAGVGYSTIETTPDGPVAYKLTIAVVSRIQHRPPADDVRTLLRGSAEVFVRSMGEDPDKKMTVSWSTLGECGPALTYETEYTKDSVRFVSRNLSVMDDISIVTVGVTMAADLAKRRRDSTAKFLATFMVRSDPKPAAVGDYVQSVAAGAGGRAQACPESLASDTRKGVEGSGGTFLGIACFVFADMTEDVQTKIDSMQNKLALGSRKVPWKPRAQGGVRQVIAYGGGGVAWLVIPATALPAELGFPKAGVVVIAQMMR